MPDSSRVHIVLSRGSAVPLCTSVTEGYVLHKFSERYVSRFSDARHAVTPIVLIRRISPIGIAGPPPCQGLVQQIPGVRGQKMIPALSDITSGFRRTDDKLWAYAPALSQAGRMNRPSFV